MARLKALRATLATLPTRLGVVAGDERERNRRRAELEPWRAWYKTKRWQQLRLEILLRDSYTCRKSGKLLGGKHPAPDSPVVDHIRPHRGDPALFWDPANLQTLSKQVHDSEKQAEERARPGGGAKP